MTKEQIRAIALGIFRKNDAILVFEGYNPITKKFFYRPLGGGIEFGEYGHQTLAREMKEELNVEVTNLRYLATVQNIFNDGIRRGHEIVQLYEGEFTDPTIYERTDLEAHENDGTIFKVVWKPLADFKPGEPSLYPNGLLELLMHCH